MAIPWCTIRPLARGHKTPKQLRTTFEHRLKNCIVNSKRFFSPPSFPGHWQPPQLGAKPSCGSSLPCARVQAEIERNAYTKPAPYHGPRAGISFVSSIKSTQSRPPRTITVLSFLPYRGWLLPQIAWPGKKQSEARSKRRGVGFDLSRSSEAFSRHGPNITPAMLLASGEGGVPTSGTPSQVEEEA